MPTSVQVHVNHSFEKQKISNSYVTLLKHRCTNEHVHVHFPFVGSVWWGCLVDSAAEGADWATGDHTALLQGLWFPRSWPLPDGKKIPGSHTHELYIYACMYMSLCDDAYVLCMWFNIQKHGFGQKQHPRVRLVSSAEPLLNHLRYFHIHTYTLCANFSFLSCQSSMLADPGGGNLLGVGGKVQRLPEWVRPWPDNLPYSRKIWWFGGLPLQLPN